MEHSAFDISFDQSEGVGQLVTFKPWPKPVTLETDVELGLVRHTTQMSTITLRGTNIMGDSAVALFPHLTIADVKPSFMRGCYAEHLVNGCDAGDATLRYPADIFRYPGQSDRDPVYGLNYFEANFLANSRLGYRLPTAREVIAIMQTGACHVYKPADAADTTYPDYASVNNTAFSIWTSDIWSEFLLSCCQYLPKDNTWVEAIPRFTAFSTNEIQRTVLTFENGLLQGHSGVSQMDPGVETGRESLLTWVVYDLA